VNRLFCLILVAAFAVLAGNLAGTSAPVRKQRDDADPPKHFTNSLGIKFVWIPPGTFLMGSPKNEARRNDNEVQHKVTLTKGFYMGIHLVTQEQYETVMGNNPSTFRGGKELAGGKCFLG
jgi:formylglycine-generating enzyme required for sulfatase activity